MGEGLVMFALYFYTMRIEKIYVWLFIIVLVMRSMHADGWVVLFTLSGFSLSLLYCIGSFWLFSDGSLRRQNLLLSIVSGFIFSLATIGTIFKIMHFPGYGLQLLISVCGLFLVLVAVAVLMMSAPLHLLGYYKKMLGRTLTWLALTFILLVMPLRVLLRTQYWNDPEYVEIAAKHYTEPDNKKYEAAYNEYRQLHNPDGRK